TTESKPPVKKDWKYLAVAGIFGLVAGGGILLLRAMQPYSPPAQPIVQQAPPLSPSLQPSPSAQTMDTSGWQTYRNEGPSPGTGLYPATEPQGEFGFEVKYPEDWTVRQRDNALHFLPPGEQSPEKGITLVIIDYNKTPPLPVFYTDTSLRTLEWQGKQVSIKKREPYPMTIRYIGELTRDGYVAEFRMHLDGRYDRTFDQILSTFRFTPQ
ncbi:MAG: hypothetical protein AABX37_02820, partial [Nanoarchaeota archaeon]